MGVTQNQYYGQYKECEGSGNRGQDGAADTVCCKSKGAVCCSAAWESRGNGGSKSSQCPQSHAYLKEWSSTNPSSSLMKSHGQTSVLKVVVASLGAVAAMTVLTAMMCRIRKQWHAHQLIDAGPDDEDA